MIGLNFSIEGNNAEFIKNTNEVRRMIMEVSAETELKSGEIASAINRISLVTLEKFKEIMCNLPNEVKVLELYQKQIVDLEERIEAATKSVMRLQDKANQPINSNYNEVEKDILAYDELLISVSNLFNLKKQNLSLIFQEQTALTLNQKELKIIEEVENRGLELLEAQQTRRSQLTDSIVNQKQTISSLLQFIDSEIKMEEVASYSVDEMRKSFEYMQTAYGRLEETEQYSAFGKELLRNINAIDLKIKKLDTTIKDNQSKVSDYNNQWNGLGACIREVTSEVTSITDNIKTFFGVMGKNMPSLVDVIGDVKEKNELLTQQNKATIPTWKQVVSSLFSWQSIMKLGIATLALYSDKLIDWVCQIFESKKAIDANKIAIDVLNNAQRDGLKDSTKEVTHLRTLYSVAVNVAKSDKERVSAIRMLKQEYPDYFGAMDNESIKAGKASRMYKELTSNIIASAKARRVEKLVTSEYNNYLDYLGETTKVAIKLKKAEIEAEQASKDLDEAAKNGYVSDFLVEEFREKNKTLASVQEEYEKASEKSLNQLKVVNKVIDTIDVKALYGDDKERNEASIANKEYWLEQLDIANSVLDKIDDKQLLILKSGIKSSIAKIPMDIVQQYQEAEELKKQAETALNVYDDNKGNNPSFDKQQKKINELRERKEIEQKQSFEGLKSRTKQAEISMQNEGVEDPLVQMKSSHKNELDELTKYKEDYLQKKIDLEKEISKANQKNENEAFDPSTVSLNEEEENMFSNLMDFTEKKQGKEVASFYKDILSKYQGYAEKRLSVQQKFEQEREALTKAGASKETLAEHDYQKEGALEAVDSEFAMREDSFQSWTNRIANMSLEQLQKLLFQAEQELQRSEFLSPNDPKLAGQRAKVSSLKNEISEKTNEIQTAPEKRGIKEWQELYKTLGNVESGFNEIGDAVGGTAGEIISAAGGIASSTLQMIDGIVMLANGSSSAMSGTAQAASTSIQTVEKASVILAIIGAALQVATKIADMFGADYSDYDTAKENYESYVKVLDVIIGKQKELLETLTGKAAVEASQKAIGLIEKEANAARTLGKERLNAGASAGSHSIGVRMRKGMNNEGWAEWNNFANSIGMNPDDIGNRMTGLFDLTAEQLATLQRDAPTFWAKLDGDVREYLEQIIACNEETEEMRDLLNESLTQVSFDDVFSSFLDALSDMDSSSEEFANNFEKYMQKAILNSMLIDNYKSRINEWYKAFAKANESGGIDEKEYADLQENWNGIVSDALEERNALMQQFGWSSGEESSSQSSTQKGFAAMSQDTGDELNGRFTALQISNEEIKNSMLFVLGSLSSLCTTASDSNLLLTDMRNLAVMSNGHLEDIAKYTKVLLGFGEKLDNIDRNTKNI